MHVDMSQLAGYPRNQPESNHNLVRPALLENIILSTRCPTHTLVIPRRSAIRNLDIVSFCFYRTGQMSMQSVTL